MKLPAATGVVAEAPRMVHAVVCRKDGGQLGQIGASIQASSMRPSSPRPGRPSKAASGIVPEPGTSTASCCAAWSTQRLRLGDDVNLQLASGKPYRYYSCRWSRLKDTVVSPSLVG